MKQQTQVTTYNKYKHRKYHCSKLRLFSNFDYPGIQMLSEKEFGPQRTENTQCLSFWAQVVLCSTIYPRFICLPATFMISFSYTAEQNYTVCMYRLFITHSSVGRHRDGFYSLAIVSKAAMNVAEQGSMEEDLKSFECMSGSDIAES